MNSKRASGKGGRRGRMEGIDVYILVKLDHRTAITTFNLSNKISKFKVDQLSFYLGNFQRVFDHILHFKIVPIF